MVAVRHHDIHFIKLFFSSQTALVNFYKCANPKVTYYLRICTTSHFGRPTASCAHGLQWRKLLALMAV